MAPAPELQLAAHVVRSALQNPDSISQLTLEDIRDAFATELDSGKNRLVTEFCAQADFLDSMLNAVDHYHDTNKERAAIILEIVFHALYNYVPITETFVRRWFESKLVSSMTLGGMNSADMLNVRVNLICILILHTVRNITQAEVSSSATFLSSVRTLKMLHDKVLVCAHEGTAPTICLVWGLVLHALSLDFSKKEWVGHYASFLEHISMTETTSPARTFIESAVRNQVTIEMSQLVALMPSRSLTCHYLLLEITCETIELVKLSDGLLSILSTLVVPYEIARYFWQTQTSIYVLNSAQSIFPWSRGPLLTLMSSLSCCATESMEYLEQFSTLTSVLPKSVQNPATVSTTNTGQVVLKCDLILGSGITLRAGTTGVSKIDAGMQDQAVIRWSHNYHPLHYLTFLLNNSIGKELTEQESIEVGHVIDIFRNLMSNHAEPLDIGEQSPISLTAVIFQLMQQQISQFVTHNIITSCFKYFLSLLDNQPDIAWQYLVHLPIFQTESSQISLVNILPASTEYITLLLQLLSSVVDSLQNRTNLALPQTIQTSRANFLKKLVTGFLHLLERPLFNVLADIDRIQAFIPLMRDVCTIVQVSVTSPASDTSPSLPQCNMFQETAASIARQLRGDTKSHFRDVIIQLLLESCKPGNTSQAYSNCAENILLFLTSYLQYDTSIKLETDPAFTTMLPQLLKSLQTQTFRQKTTYSFLEVCVRYHKVTGASPLVPHRHLCQTIFNLASPTSHYDSVASAAFWEYVGSLLIYGPEVLSIALLKPESGTSIMILAKKALLEQFENNTHTSTTTLMILQVMNAMLSWPFLCRDMQEDTELWTEQLPSLFSVEGQIGASATQTAIQVKCQTAALKLLASRLNAQTSGEGLSITESILMSLDGLPQNVYLVEGFRFSLHANLTRNLAKNFGGLSLESLRLGSNFRREQYGSFYYNLDLASAILPKAYYTELQIMDSNLAHVDAQILRIHALHSIAHTLLIHTEDTPQYWQTMQTVFKAIVTATNEEAPTSMKIKGERAELIALLAQRLTDPDKAYKHCTVLNGSKAIVDALNSITRAVSNRTQNGTAIEADLGHLLRACGELLRKMQIMATLYEDIAELPQYLAALFEVCYCKILPCLMPQSQPEEVIDLLDILNVLARLLFEVCAQNNIPYSLFAIELSQTTTARVLLQAISRLECTELGWAQAASCLSLIQTLFDLIGGPYIFIDAGLLNFLLESVMCVQLAEQLDLLNTVYEYRAWVRGILPILLSIANIYVERRFSEVRLVCDAFVNRIAEIKEAWMSPVYLSQDLVDELYLIALLQRSLSSAQPIEAPPIDTSWITDVSTSIERLLSHPKSTRSIVQGQDEREVDRVLDAIKLVQEALGSFITTP